MQKTSAIDYISAIELHGYFDNVTSVNILDEIQEKFPDKSIWYSEVCFGANYNPLLCGPRLGLWHHSEDLIGLLIKRLGKLMFNET